MERVDYQSMIIQDLVNDHKDEKLELNPWYQRRSVWTRPQKAYLINTLFERKPIPALYVRHSIDLEKSKSVKEVVDGQQRARAILEYCLGEFSALMPDGISRKTFLQLTVSEREKFLLTSIPVGFLLGATDSDVIDIFARINSVSKTLNDQEKRNSQFSGEFKQFALGQSVNRLDFWRSITLFTSNDISRMIEVQFMSDIIANLIRGLSDFSQSFLNKIYKQYDEEFPLAESVSSRLNAVFEKLYSLDKKVLTDTIFSRQPLFFSLIFALDAHPDINLTKLESAIRTIDAKFSDESVLDEGVVAFRKSIDASTQRISSRKVRNDFIGQHFA